jgi:hypothetical protein
MAKTPKKVMEAFSASGASVAGIELREFTIGTMLVLEKIDSPLMTGKPEKPREQTNLETLRLVFVLSHSPTECFRLLRNGLDAFDEAVATFADGITPTTMEGLGQRVRELFAKAMTTAPSSDDGNVTGKKNGVNNANLSQTSRNPEAETAGA